MRTIHAVIIAQIRLRIESPLSEKIQNWSDVELLRRMFANYRDERVLRLTQFGEQLMHHCFQSFEFEVADMQPAQLIFLSTRCKMPYFCGDKKLVVYDPRFAVMLRLVDANINTMMEIDSGD